MEDTKIEDDQRYKLLSEGERRFLEIPESELDAHYKRPDLAKKQFLLKIKWRAKNAIKEIAWLCEKLPEDRLKKIFTDDRIEDLFKINEKALGVAEWIPDPQIELILRRKSDNPNQTILKDADITPRVLLLESHLRELTKHFLPETQIIQHENLKNKFFIPGGLAGQLMGLNVKLGSVIQRNELMRVFIEKNGLKEKFELGIEQERKNGLIVALKSGGVPDDKIDEMLTIML